ncbi:nucleoid-associated protein [Flammeovirga aprica]|uniref:Nucleoid-associated protein n=1 Tax=Flammeovirga aprica JL-4 TaxID=694437 RepID=A0A7X9XBD3_9BACT|nr:nucleoid-associated protein [Flammeovirga aprica]NME70528.1 nucleoid-associated protein [Flammeovirga aprica JL-4]
MSKIKSFDLSNVKLSQLVIHKVGNKTQEEPIELAEFEIEIENYSPLYKSVMDYFLKSFKPGPMYHFAAPEGQESFTDNEVFVATEAIFSNPYEQFMTRSREMAELLFEASTHPRIKGGELFIAVLRDCVVDGDVVDAIGLFKAEHKEMFLTVGDKTDVGNFELEQSEGVSVKKLDKGCLIFKCEEEKGFKVMLKDSPTKSVEALYWKESFLQLKPREDNFFHTKNYLDMCVGFVEEVFNEDHAVEKPAQIDLLNRSLKYFNEKEDFNVVDFENNVIEEPEAIEAFQEYKVDFQEKKEIPVFDEFKVSKEAVRKSKKEFKSIIKLDKKINITISGNEQNVEKGYDSERNMNYYMIFFNEEE